ncbi:MAG: hypothetical protein ABI689_12035 [Thermoanaerobaculia bacterium]
MDLRICSRRFRSPHFSLMLWVLVGLLGLQARLLPAADGLDDNPGALTYVAFDLQSPGTDQALACAAQADGQIVLAGRAADDDGELAKIAVTRVGTNGGRDLTFGEMGRVTIDMSTLGHALNTANATAVLLDSQQRLLVVGTARLTVGGAIQAFVLRLLANGTIDQTFLYNGIAGGWYFSGYLGGVTAAALDGVGNLSIVGPKLENLTGGWGYIRLDPNGLEIDVQTVSVTSYPWSSPTAILFQPDSKPVIGGWGQEDAPPFYSSFLVYRMLAGAPGVPDNSFGFTNDGWLNLDYPQAAKLQSLALLPNRGLVVAGQIGPLGQEDILVQRLTPNGVADGSFDTYVAFDVGGSNGDGSGGQIRMVAQSDGKIVLAARVATGDTGNTSDVGVARLLPDNQLDTSFGGLGTGKRVFGLAFPPPGNGDDGLTCLVLAAGRPVVAGWAEYIGQDTDFATRRLTSALIFTDGFESGYTFFWK